MDLLENKKKLRNSKEKGMDKANPIKPKSWLRFEGAIGEVSVNKKIPLALSIRPWAYIQMVDKGLVNHMPIQ